MDEIEKSIKIQKQIFYAYQPFLLKFLNSEEGRDLLHKKLKLEIEYPVIKVGRNSLHQKATEKEFIGTFWPRQPFTDFLLPIIEKESLRREGIIIPKYFDDFKREKLLEGFNPLYFKEILQGNYLLTATFNPAAGANSPVDGDVWNNPADTTWATIRGAASGTTARVTNTDLYMMYVASGAASPNWANIIRGFFLFDTSSLTSSAVISAANIQIFIITADNTPNMSQRQYIVTTTPASNANLVVGDFSQTGTTSQGDTPLISALTASAYNTWNLNATGISNISLTGISKFGGRGSGDATNTEPTWPGAGLDNAVNGNSADNASNKPVLTVTYTLPSGTAAFKTLLGVGQI